MNFLNCLYDLMVYLSNNYSSMPSTFRSRFSEASIVNARIFLSDFVDSDSDFNKSFKRYE